MQTAAIVALRAGNALLSLFFPPHCAGCAVSLNAGEFLCERCATRAERIRPPFCRCCSQPFDGALEDSFTCLNCADRALHFDCAVPARRATGVVRDLIHRFKYDKERFLRRALAHWLADTLDDERLAHPPVDFIVPVPLHPTRFRERGFNQAEVLARLLSERSHIPLLPCLRRTRYTTTQTVLDRHARMENLRDAFLVQQNAPVPSRHLLLVDDVFTTGSTVDECARVLRLAGAASVRVATVARG